MASSTEQIELCGGCSNCDGNKGITGACNNTSGIIRCTQQKLIIETGCNDVTGAPILASDLTDVELIATYTNEFGDEVEMFNWQMSSGTSGAYFNTTAAGPHAVQVWFMPDQTRDIPAYVDSLNIEVFFNGPNGRELAKSCRLNVERNTQSQLAAPIADFSCTPTYLDVVLDASLSDVVHHNREIASYTWSFGDGTDDVVVDPAITTTTPHLYTHTYAAAGNYQVCLKIALKKLDDKSICEKELTAEVTKLVCVKPVALPLASFAINEQNATSTMLNGFTSYAAESGCSPLVAFDWQIQDYTDPANPVNLAAFAGDPAAAAPPVPNVSGTIGCPIIDFTAFDPCPKVARITLKVTDSCGNVSAPYVIDYNRSC